MLSQQASQESTAVKFVFDPLHVLRLAGEETSSGAEDANDQAPSGANDEAPGGAGGTGNSLEDAARGEWEYVRERLRGELKREPTDEEIDKWLREQTEGY